METVTITDSMGHPLEGVIIMVTNGPVSVPDIASVTDVNGVGSLGNLSVPGQYTLNLHQNQQQRERQIQYKPGQSLTVVF